MTFLFGRSAIKAILEYPNALVGVPAAVVLVVSFVFCLIWVFTGIAIVHPLYPLLGLLSALGILAMILIGDRS